MFAIERQGEKEKGWKKEKMLSFVVVVCYFDVSKEKKKKIEYELKLNEEENGSNCYWII